MLTIDTGTVFDHYRCDFNRNFAIEGQNDRGETDHTYIDGKNAILWEATECGLRAAGPGVPLRDVWEAMMGYMETMGENRENYVEHRFGHSIGLQLTELPSIAHTEDSVMLENMVFSIEPCIKLESGNILVHEECVAITRDGCRLLTERAPRACQRIKVNSTYNHDSCNTLVSLQRRNDPSPETLQLLEGFAGKQPLCENFHKMIRAGPTPLLSMPILQEKVGVAEILVKDEGRRLGLKSFKGLGASFAVHALSDDPETLCTMTDGNHGKAVAYAASKIGADCVVYVPGDMTEPRKKAIRELGAEVVVVDGSYDDAIEVVKAKAEENGWCLISDTAWEGYTEIPRNIMAGYGTIFREVEEQRQGAAPITHVVIQAGVGGLASAALAWAELRRDKTDVWADDIQLIVVEPLAADCMAANISQPREQRYRERP